MVQLLKTTLYFLFMLTLALIFISCAGVTPKVYPQVSSKANKVLNLHSNKSKTDFLVDGKKVATGKRVKVLVEEDKSYTIIAKPENYNEKEYYIQPPYTNYPISFTFMIGDISKQLTKKTQVYDKQSFEDIYTFRQNKKSSPNTFALIIGIDEYAINPNVRFADTSAKAFRKLAITNLGIPESNVILITNEQATSGQIKSKIKLLKELSEKGGDLYFYYAGHGVPSVDGEAYLLPTDMSADNINLEPQLKFTNIYAELEQSSSDNIFVFVDSCFSGKDDSGDLLYKGVAPVLKTTKTEIKSKRMTVLTAGGPKDFANDYIEKKQRMFTYFLIHEMTSESVNLSKVFSNIKSKVKRASLLKGLGYKQVPQMHGAKKGKQYY